MYEINNNNNDNNDDHHHHDNVDYGYDDDHDLYPAGL